jgi:uncharacterized repeat protein (TIGR03803 family)
MNDMKTLRKIITITIVCTLFSIKMLAQTTEIWGMTYQGGNYDIGTIFKTDANGNNQIVKKDFFKVDGINPARTKLLKASNGKLYGLTSQGGEINSSGVLFEYDYLSNTYIKRFNFINLESGRYPLGSLIEASNGKLYGMTSGGGQYYFGVLFEFSPTTNTFNKIIDFKSIDNGETPYGSLLETSNGKLYGLTSDGGVNGKGVLFEFDPITNVFTKKFDFDGTTSGSTPLGTLIEASNGKLYGMTNSGGLYNSGVLFEFDKNTDTFIKKIDFKDTLNGSFPEASLIEATNGKLYGTTANGGNEGLGVIFEYDPILDTLIKKLDFDGTQKGSNPRNLELASDGKLYGNAIHGGANNIGVIFVYDPATNIFEKKLDFDGTSKGGNPCPITEVTIGKFYGMTSTGGNNDNGVLYEYESSTEVYTKKLDLGDETDGNMPGSSLLQASNGKFYGLASAGGLNSYGTIFEYNPNNSVYTKIYDFDRYPNGSSPYGSLMQASNGKLYGMTSEGGVNDDGVLFEYNISTNTYLKKYDFGEMYDGKNPFGSLIQAPNGKLYGMTTGGGINAEGILFEFDPSSNVYSKKHDFGGMNTEENFPYGELLLASNGKLYGMTYSGGTTNGGVIFEYNQNTNIYTIKYTFNQNNDSGHWPYGSLIEVDNGKFYGMTEQGGTSHLGVIFEYNLNTNTYTKKIDFDGTAKGKNPIGTLLKAKNGKLYGMTPRGGANNYGVVFEYNPNTNIYSKKLDFNIVNGKIPQFGHLIEVTICTNTTSNINVTSCPDYTTPSGNQTFTNSGQYVVSDTVINSCGLDSIINIQLTIIDIIDTSITLINQTLTANQSGASYRWYNCNTASFIIGATNQSYTATANGNYSVEITAGNCVSTSNCIEINSIGINEITSESGIKIYPNPSNGLVNIELGELKNATIKVYNSLWQLIYNVRDINTQAYSFELNNYSGVYFIEISSGENTQIFKCEDN